MSEQEKVMIRGGFVRNCRETRSEKAPGAEPGADRNRALGIKGRVAVVL